MLFRSTAAEWAYVIKGTTQVTTVTPDGQNYVGTVVSLLFYSSPSLVQTIPQRQGDLWYFPPGQPHSLQATADDPEGTEFLLVFDNGEFDDGGTFLLTDWLAHVPKEVIAKNFQTSISAFDSLPDRDLYIFPGRTSLNFALFFAMPLKTCRP